MENEKNIVDNVVKNLKCEHINLVGKTDLKTLCAVVDKCSLTISNDNGIAHISAALDKPTIIIFGPTNPKWFYPYNKRSGYVYKNYKCSPCGIKTSCKNNKCMENIKPEEVFEYIKTNFVQYLL